MGMLLHIASTFSFQPLGLKMYKVELRSGASGKFRLLLAAVLSRASGEAEVVGVDLSLRSFPKGWWSPCLPIGDLCRKNSSTMRILITGISACSCPAIQSFTFRTVSASSAHRCAHVSPTDIKDCPGGERCRCKEDYRRCYFLWLAQSA